MKKITITFIQAGKEVGSVEGRFAGFPGRGNIQWTNAAQMTALLGMDLLAAHYAENFEEAYTALAESKGLGVAVKKMGNWIVYDENDIVEV